MRHDCDDDEIDDGDSRCCRDEIVAPSAGAASDAVDDGGGDGQRRRAAAPLPPDAFRQGMLVLHADYGLGQIIALSGSGAGRKATVDFSPPAGRKKFLLAESPLRPVGA